MAVLLVAEMIQAKDTGARGALVQQEFCGVGLQVQTFYWAPVVSYCKSYGVKSVSLFSARGNPTEFFKDDSS